MALRKVPKGKVWRRRKDKISIGICGTIKCIMSEFMGGINDKILENESEDKLDPHIINKRRNMLQNFLSNGYNM